jgi:type IV pilus assembly protein PilB
MQSQNVDVKELLRILYKEEEVDQSVANVIYKEIKKNGTDLIEACTSNGVREDAVLYALSAMHGLELIQLDGIVLPPPIIERVPAHVANSYRIIPVRLDGGVLVIATADPDNLAALDDLKFMLGVTGIKPGLTSEGAIDRALELYYHLDETDAAIDELLTNYGSEVRDELDTEAFDIGNFDDLQNTDVGQLAESEAVRKLLNLILLTAVKAQAADIHLEPFEDSFKVRNRIDGVLYEMLPVPKELAPALVARVKVMSHLDIAERRLPQDGKISINIGNKSIDLRVSTLPTMFGESVVIRILDRSVVSLDLDKIGMPDHVLEHFRRVITKPNGIVVVTGPTGSGKTTSLYAALNEANEESVKIITTEDPVEYEIDGLVQVPIDDEIGKTFSKCLRSILRQDPDKILVGEVRDIDTAKIAIEASLTGHIVFTTLHTNDAPTAITRLIDMGLEPFLIAATLDTILAQRLVRTICVECKAAYQPSDEEMMMLGIKPEEAHNQRFYYGKGCDRCKGTGYKGRTAVFEMLTITDDVRDLILNKSSSGHIRATAMRSGMTNLRDAGVQKIFAGLTTIEEVVRETIAMDD